MPRVKEQLLKNGLKVITKRNAAAPVVSVFMWYRVGARNEMNGQSGLAHFLEHMLFKGTKSFPKGEISRLIERTGGQQNAFTSYDYTAYYETLPSDYLELALQIQADRMDHALLDPREVAKERTVILSELEGNLNHPQVRFRDLLNAKTWINHPYRRPVIGWKEEVENITQAQLLAFYRQHYTPKNATLVVVGDFEEKKLAKLIGKLFDRIPRRPIPQAPLIPAELSRGLQRVVMEDHGPTPMLHINLAVPKAGHRDHYALSVLNDVLTKGKTSRLYRALVDTGLVTDIYASPYEMIDPGVWSFKAFCQPTTSPQQVEDVVLEQFSQVCKYKIQKRELQQAVNQTRAQLVFSKDSITDQAMILGFYETVAGDWRIPDLYPAEVAKVTAEQIHAVAQKYLILSNLTIGHFLPLGSKLKTIPLQSPKAGRVGKPKQKPKKAQDVFVSPKVMNSKKTAQKNEKFLHGCYRYVLSNKLTLLIHPNPGNPMVALSGLVKGGSSAAPAETPGIAWVHAHMLDRGTCSRDAKAIADELEFKGSQLLYTARREELQITGEALSEELPCLLAILGESILQPAFPEDELRKVRRELLATCHQLEQNSDMQAWQHFHEMAYPPGHPVRRSLLTSADSISKIKRQALQRYHQTSMCPNKTVLSIAGDVDPEMVVRWVEKYLGHWRASELAKNIAKPINTDMKPVKKFKRHVHQLSGKRETIVVLGHAGLHRSHPDYYAAFVANQVLGGAGLSSLLMQEVRDQAGLTYSIYSHFRVSQGERPWSIVFQADPQKVEEAIRISWQQVRRLQTGKFKPQQLKDTQERLVGGLAMNMETNTGIAHLNREIEYHQLGADYMTVYAQQIRRITVAQVKNAAQKWFHPSNYLLSIVAPKK